MAVTQGRKAAPCASGAGTGRRRVRPVQSKAVRMSMAERKCGATQIAGGDQHAGLHAGQRHIPAMGGLRAAGGEDGEQPEGEARGNLAADQKVTKGMMKTSAISRPQQRSQKHGPEQGFELCEGEGMRVVLRGLLVEGEVGGPNPARSKAG